MQEWGDMTGRDTPEGSLCAAMTALLRSGGGWAADEAAEWRRQAGIAIDVTQWLT
jgi:hypothetical protein